MGGVMTDGSGRRRVRVSRKSPLILLSLSVLLVVVVFHGEAQTIRYVDIDATGANNGSSWANAFTDLQAALAAPETVDEIWVAEGTYTPSVPAGRDATFQLIDGVALYGGFAGTEDKREGRNRTAHETILSGDLGGNDAEVIDPADLLTEPTRSENSYHVVTGTGTDATAVLDGFTVIGGNAYEHADSYWSGDPRLQGGGMYNDGGSPTVTHCTFTGNASYFGGGGMYNKFSSPTVINCTFLVNKAGLGGGMYNILSGPAVTSCTFSGNVANAGGGMYNHNRGSPTLINCTFSGNEAAYGGGMRSVLYSNPTVVSCTFFGNSTSDSGGGMDNLIGSVLTLKNTIVADNTGGDCSCDAGSSIDSAGYNLDSDGSCGFTRPTDLPSGDPRLGPLQDNGGSTLTHALLPGSPAIDAGSCGDISGNLILADQRGYPRPAPVGGVCDVGAYEFEQAYARGDVNGDSVVDLLDVVLCAQIAQGHIAGTAAQRGAADVDGDNDVDAGDVTILSEYVLGIRSAQP